MTNTEFRKWRRSQEITQQEVGFAVGVSKSCICRWEKGNLEIAEPLYLMLMQYVKNYEEVENENHYK